MTKFLARLSIHRGVALVAVALCGCDFLAGPQATVMTSLRTSAGVGKTLFIPGCGTLTVTSSAFDRFVTKREGDTIVATSTVDLEGTFGDGLTRVSYLGREETPFVSVLSTGWQPRETPLPKLTEVLACMCASEVRAGDSEIPGDANGAGSTNEKSAEAITQKVARWIVRVSKDEAIVLEESRGGGRRRVVLTEKGGRLCAAPLQTSGGEESQDSPGESEAFYVDQGFGR